MSETKIYGLIGFPLTHSFSQKYFSQKFEKERIADHKYELFELEAINQIEQLVRDIPNLKGLNVTIPYKQAIHPFLDQIDQEAATVGAVNTIKISSGKLVGYNSDIYGFEQSLIPLLSNKVSTTKALVLGTGGASLAVKYVLKKAAIPFLNISRTNTKADLTYDELNEEIISTHHLIINCTPLGTYPAINNCPNIPYDLIGNRHYLYDLVYNPAQTLFLKKGKAKGAVTCNGLSMLHLQAEKAWEIWNNPDK